ncbi:fatty acid-binding protein DegV [Bhargavaea cecembensis]|uniref:Fatty acid-binding protein DegV n=1 Tax=Bhargavaea cecembensis TaxID=394098 RepID=A0A163FCK9_9BACL|nr:DegV family protein [Bhargavaea cecembensis]KZE38386.1 fatty acid-binding protein DegV [Bhargavaea cecembensis]
MKTAIVTDSTAYLPGPERDRLGIRMVPLSVTIDGKTYEEEVDLETDRFYDLVKEGELPKTSQPPIGKFTKCFESLREEGFDAVVVVTLSSGISGTFNSAVQAGDLVDDLDVRVFDSEIACMPQGFYVTRAAGMAIEGASPESIMAELNRMKKNLSAYFMVDDLSHLQRGGRLSGAQALIGGLLQVKPLLHFEDRVIVPFEKIRTRKKAMNRIADLLARDTEEGPLEAAIIHANRREDAEAWRAELSGKFPDVDITISHFGPVIGTHLGEGAMGLGWVKK